MDGFRLDTIKHIDHAFWQEHRRRVNQELGDDFFLLGELWGGSAQSLNEYFKNDEIDAGFDFQFHGSVTGWLLGNGRSVALGKYLQKRSQRVKPGYLLAHYTSSHDETGAIYNLDYNYAAFKALVGVQMAVNGIPVIFYGEEVGRDIGKWPDNRSHMPWGDKPIQPGQGKRRDENMRQWYKTLISLRKQNPALYQGGFDELDFTNKQILVFGKQQQANKMIVLVSRSNEQQTISLNFNQPRFKDYQTDAVTDLILEQAYPLEQNQLNLSLAPYQVMYLQVTQ